MLPRAAKPQVLRRLAASGVSSVSTSSRLAVARLASSSALASSSPAASTSSRALLLLLLSTSTSVALLARKKMESADAVRAEELYNDNAYDRRKLLEDLRAMHAAHPEDIGVIWRLTRAAYDLSELKATSADEKKELIYYARDVIQKGLDLTQDVPEVHKWFGIILSSIGDYEGSKVAIANSYVIKGHWDKAIELNSNDPTTYYLLGRWCIAIADLSWLERKAAAVLFGTPPESSYQEALDFLLKSEALAPDSWKRRSLLIAQVHQKMKSWTLAKEWTNKALAIPVVSEEDQTVQDEATALLKKL